MRLFVSYARDDAGTARAVVDDLASLGHAPYFDQDLSGGQRWWDTLLDQVQECGAFLPVLSDAYRDSEACRAEAIWAESLGIPFLPVTTDQQTAGLYDPVIAEANWITYDPDSRTSLADLARAVGSLPPVAPPSSSPERPVIPLSYLNTLDRQIRGAAEIGRGDQLVLVSDLRGRLGSRDDTTVRALLTTLRARPEITYQAATMIDELLAVTSAPAGPPVAEPVAEPRRAPPPPPRRTAPTPRVVAPSAQLPRWASTSLVCGALVLILLAVVNTTWFDHGNHTHSIRFVEDKFRNLMLVLAFALSAWSVLCQLRRLPSALRWVAAGLDVLLAVAVLVYMFREQGDDTAKGPWVLAVGLLLLAVATLRPAEPPWLAQLGGRSQPLVLTLAGTVIVMLGVTGLVPWRYGVSAVGVALAVLAFAATVATITCQVREAPPVTRQVVAGLEVLLALVVLLVPLLRVGFEGVLAVNGPWLLTVGLLVLAAATYLPSQSRDRLTPR